MTGAGSSAGPGRRHGRLAIVSARVRRHGPSLALAAAAAALAFLIAGTAFGPEQAYFAPIAAVVCTGLAAGQRLRRAAEITAGVTLGLLAADLLVRVIGGGWLQLGVAVLLATVAAVALGAGPLMSNQAAIAAILVVALAPTEVTPWVRLGDALIGGTIALLLALAVPLDPRRVAARAAEEFVDALACALLDVAEALAAGDLETMEDVVDRSAELAGRVSELDDALAVVGGEGGGGGQRDRGRRKRKDPLAFVAEPRPPDRPRPGSGEHLARLARLRSRADFVVSSTRALARAAANSLRRGHPVDPRLVHAVSGLADAVRALGPWERGDEPASSVRARALAAATTGSAVLGEPHPPTATVLALQVRSGAVDVLRVSGLDQRAAIAEIERVAGPADRP
jgi:uncharacterized membrane protein YccC